MTHHYNIPKTATDQEVALAQLVELMKAYYDQHVQPERPGTRDGWQCLSRAVACLHGQAQPNWLDFAEIVRDSRSTCHGGSYWLNDLSN